MIFLPNCNEHFFIAIDHKKFRILKTIGVKGTIFLTPSSDFFQKPGFSTSCFLSRVSATSLYRSSASLVCLISQSTQPFRHSSFHPVKLAQPSHLNLRSIHPTELSFLHLVFNSTLLLNLPCLDQLDPSSVDKEPLFLSVTVRLDQKDFEPFSWFLCCILEMPGTVLEKLLLPLSFPFFFIHRSHENQNFLDCDWFKKLLFFTYSFAKLLSDSLLSDSSIS